MTTDAAHLVQTDLEALAETTAEIQRRFDERDLLVIAAFAKGASLRAIANVTGMTHVGVKKLVERRAPDFEVVGPDGERLAVAEAKVAVAATVADSERYADLIRQLTVVHTVRYDPEIEEAMTE